MVKSPGDWPWSSHKTYLGQSPNSFLTTRPVLARFSSLSNKRAREAYARFVREGLLHGHRKDLYPP
jgi:hypothetical protein